MSKFNKDKKHNNGLGNYALGDKLRPVASNLKTKRVPEIRKVTDLGPDGEDHINVYMHCKTNLGSALSPFTVMPFVHPLFGKFGSRQGLYYYLLSKDGHEAFRTMHPSKMRVYAAELTTMGKFCANLRYHMATALWAQIKDNEEVKQKLIDNQLPFEAYYLRRQRLDDKMVSIIPSRPNSNATWITRIVVVISEALKEGVIPNFDEFIDDKESLEKLKAKITRPLTPPPAPKQKKEKKPKIDVKSMEAFDQEQAVAEGQPIEPAETTDNPIASMAAFDSEQDDSPAPVLESDEIEAIAPIPMTSEQAGEVAMQSVQELEVALNEVAIGLNGTVANDIQTNSGIVPAYEN